MRYIFRIILLIIISVFFTCCSDKKSNNKLIICEKDTLWEEQEASSERGVVGKIHIQETPGELKKHNDSIAKQQEVLRLAMLEMQQVNEFKKTIYSRSIDLNFDKRKDLLIIYVIVTGRDTITYLSIYTHLDTEMKNTFDYRFDEKIDDIRDVRTFNDSTIVINAVLTKPKKSIQKKFKYINDYNFSLIN